MIIYDWPSVLTANVERFRIDARTRSGGETTAGREQVVSSGVARWMATLAVPLYTPETIRAMRSLLARLDGRANAVRIGPCDGPVGARLPAVFTPIGPLVVDPVSAGATQVTVTTAGVTEIVEGVHFGIGGHLYVVTLAEDPSPGVKQLTFAPRLRAGAAAGDEVEMKAPRCPMRLTADDSGAFDLQLARYGAATLDLVEVY